MNKLVVIGWLGCKKAYLNITRDDAIRRWAQANPGANYGDDSGDVDISEFEFEDEFSVYDAWEG